MKSGCPVWFALVFLVHGAASGELVFQEYFDYGPTKVDSGYGEWSDSTTRFWYEGTRNLVFSHASYLPGENEGTGCTETDNFDGIRGAQRSFSVAGLTGEFWLSALVRVRSGSVIRDGLILSVHDAAYSNAGAARSYIGIGDPSGISTLAPMYLPLISGTSEFGADTLFAEGTTNAAIHLLVAKFNVSSGTDTVSFWVLRSTDAFGQTEDSLGTPDLTRDADFGAAAKNVWIGQKSAASNLDALRISDAAGDVGLREVLTGQTAVVGTVIIVK